MLCNRYILALENKLRESLPGRKAHHKLAPKIRKLDINPPKNSIKAAVIILIYFPQNRIPEILFIRRPEYDGYHSGQVSFPGGKADKSDQNLKITALRECNEEVGIPEHLIKILGELTPLYIPVSNFIVYPFVGICSQKVHLITDPNEVAYTFSYPLADLTKLKIEKKILKLTNRDAEVPFYNIKNEMVWGATSMILCEFIEILKTI